MTSTTNVLAKLFTDKPSTPIVMAVIHIVKTGVAKGSAEMAILELVVKTEKPKKKLAKKEIKRLRLSRERGEEEE